MLKNITNINANMHQIKFLKTHSDYILACIPKCGSSYYAWSIFLKTYPYAQRLLDKRGENLKLLNDRDALSLSKYTLKENIKNESVILPFRDPMSRFLSIFLYLQDISEEEIIGDKIDKEIRNIVIESAGDKNGFFDYFVNTWEQIHTAIPQYHFYTNNATIISYDDTEQICKLINSKHIPQVINKGIGDSSGITLTGLQINKIKEIYKEDYKLAKCVL
jgi:hypothetical protein